MPTFKGNGIGILAVLAAFFTLTAIGLTALGNSISASASPSFSEAIGQAAGNLWIISIVLIAILVVLAIFQARGSASYSW